jgi:cell surface protein SprA
VVLLLAATSGVVFVSWPAAVRGSDPMGFEPFDLLSFGSEGDSAAAGSQTQVSPGVPGHPQSPVRDLRPDSLGLGGTVTTAQPDSTLRDSLGLPSVAKPREVPPESTYVVYLDSTARIRQFTHVRTDQPEVQLFGDRLYPLYAANRAAAFRRTMEIDSAKGRVIFRESVAGEDVRIPVSLSLEEYLARRRTYERRKLLADEVRKPGTISTKRDISELLTDLTQIQIPIPPNPILSIFGKNEIKLNISGAVDIKAGFRNTKSDQTTISRLDLSRNEPDFSQEVQVNVNGTIGDKLNILADWNTQRTFEYENQLKIKYTGYDDEIVQSVEAGNVSLQTPSGFIGSSQALFGVKAKFQTGPLTLTTLASQKKGQIKEVSVSGGAQQLPFEIRAYNYSTNHFFVDTLYDHFYEDYYQNEPPVVNGDTKIVDEEVWVQKLGSGTDGTERQGVAFISLPARPQNGYDEALRSATQKDGEIEVGRFVRLDRSQYELAGDGYLGVLSLNTNVQDQQIIAIAYRRADGSQFGEFASKDVGVDSASLAKSLILKMVKPKNLNSTGRKYAVAWRMMLKNIYPIGGRNIKKQGFELDVFRRIPGAEDENSIANQRLLRVLGVDKYNVDDTPAPTGDNAFDFRPGRTVNQAGAEIIFPYLRPFDEGIREFFTNELQQAPPDSTVFFFPEIYDTTRTFAQQSERDRYIIRGKATGDATSKYSLGFNVVEGSVQVLLDGAPLRPNLDYTVDYIVGEVVIRNDRALVPGANLQIKYEQNDLFQLASKTLLGARGDLNLGQTTNFGFTMMNLNQQTLSDKVRLGEEPNKNTILGVDGSTTLSLPFLSRAIDALPFLQTREPSQVRVTGEAAYMLPDPNTRKSTIPSDNGEGIAYIDDFEGARRTIPLGITYVQWTPSSPPADSVSFLPGVADTTKMFSKGKMVWFNRQPTDVALTDIYPNKVVGRNAANNQAVVLDFRYFPNVRGQFNYSRNLPGTLTPQRNWGGVMKPISIAGTNLINENVSFIELWMQVDRAPLGAKMLVDLGSISEDAVPNRSLNTEDLVPPSTAINGTLQPWEDVGLDMLDNAGEIAQFGTDLGPDPSGDDYAYDPRTVGTAAEDYTHINGSDNNRNGPGGLIPDTEDLNSNGIVDLGNSYYEYEVTLDTVGGPGGQNPLIVGGGNKGWYQFRVPIREWTRTVGTPNLENVEFVRVLFVNELDTVAVRIADFSLVGSQWQELQKDDPTFAVTVVSVEDNLDYIKPPGVEQERDKTRPDDDIRANEQSLALLLKGVPYGESRQAVKYYTFRPLDLFNYRTMKMFLHADTAFQYRDEQNYDAEIFFRFGVDSLNFYEYRAPLRQDPGPPNYNWSEIAINFADLTAIKQGRDSINIITAPTPARDGPPGAVYRVLGNPSLTQVRYLALGVTNRRPNREPLYGEVWFNELRLTSVDDTPGWAYRFDSQLKIADLGAVSFNYSRIDPNFHTLEQRFGSRQTGTNWALSTTMQFEKFLPDSWVGTSIPFSYSHTVGRIQPKYLPNSDVVVSQASEQERLSVLSKGGSEAEANAAADRVVTESETYRVTDTYAVPSFKVGLPSQAWYIRDIVNKLLFGFNYTRSSERNPATVRALTWSWNGKISYAVSLPTDYFFTPFKGLFDGLWFLDEYKDLKIYYAPTSFTWSLNAIRSRSVGLQRAPGAQETITRNFTASRAIGFGWKLSEGGLLNPSGEYNLNIESSLLDLETDRNNRQRSFSKIVGDIFFGDKVVNFGQDTRYSQRNQFNTKPNIPNIFGIKRYLDLTFSYNVDYSWQNTLTRGDLGKSAGWNNTINFSANFKLKQLFDPLFQEGPSNAAARQRGRRGEVEPAAPAVQDTTRKADTTSAGGPSGLEKTLANMKSLLKLLIKVPLLDYDNVNVTFTQNNNAQNSGVVGRTGFVNFWGRVPFFQDSDPKYGPSRLYQLGLISDPSGKLKNFGFRSQFPFFGADVEPGVRASGGVLINTFRQTNRLTFKTSRALWEGARLDLNWNIGWSYSRTENVVADSITGLPNITSSSTSGSIERSFLTFPDVLFLGMFKSSLKDVSKRYAQLKTDASLNDEERLTKAFEEGFEALPVLRKLFGQYYPRFNWVLRWDGLEKIPMFAGFVNRLSLDHSYTSTFTRQFRNQPGGGGERTDAQRVSYGFAPLVGLNFTFKELLKGSFGANFRYNTNTAFDFSPSSRNIVETLSQEISLTASYNRKGFEIPLFGLALNNDVDISFSYSISKNSRKTYDVSRLDVNTEGTPLEGSTRTVMEPRIKYVLSLRVTASVYYRYTKIAPDSFGSRIPGSTTNEAGLDIHISIQ